MTRLAVLATMRNEGPFLLEWVAHHKVLGFDDIVICTNDCADGTDAMVRRLEELGLARHHATVKRGSSIQRAAYRQARALPEVAGAGWLWVCDADEFLVVKVGDGTVGALIAAGSSGGEVISVPWRIFGTAGIVAFEDRPVTAQFLRCEAPLGRPVFGKSLIRAPGDAGRIGRIGIHAPEAAAGAPPLRREAPGGRAVREGLPLMVRARHDVAQVNHYALRSAESFLVKRDRGRVNHVGQDMGADYWRRFDLNAVEDRAIARYAGAAAAWGARLRADGALAALHRAAVDWHRRRIAELRREPDMAAFLAAGRAA
jgi:hypothetical protein